MTDPLPRMPLGMYAHMCRDGHVEIGHNDSSSELCPLCRAIADKEAACRSVLRAFVQQLKEKRVDYGIDDAVPTYLIEQKLAEWDAHPPREP